MSSTGGNDGDGNAPTSAETTADEPLPNGNGSQPPQAPAGEGTQGTGATEQPDVQAAGQGGERPHGQRSQSMASARSNGSAPATPSRAGFMTSLFGGNRYAGVNRRRSSSATAGSVANPLQRSDTSALTRPRPGSIVEEPETLEIVEPEIVTREPPTLPELVGPSRVRLHSRGSGSQREGGSPPAGDKNGTQPTRPNRALTLASEAGEIEATGENNPSLIGGHNRRTPYGLKTITGSLPNAPGDPNRELDPRNRAFLNIFEQMRAREITNNWERWQQGNESARDFVFQLGPDTLDAIAEEGVEGIRRVLAEAGERVPADVRDQITQETQARTQAARARVGGALAEERTYIENSARTIMDLMEMNSPIRKSRRGTSRGSGASSLDPNATEPQANPLSRGALMTTPREQLVDRALDLENQRREALEATNAAEDTERNALEQIRTLTRDLDTQRLEHARENQRLQQTIEYYEAQEGTRAPGPSRQNGEREPSQDSSPESTPGEPSRSRASSAPRSPARERAFMALANVLNMLGRQEELVRGLQGVAGLNPEGVDVRVPPFSENAQLSRTQLLINLRDALALRDERTRERDDARAEADRLAAENARLEDARASPPTRSDDGRSGGASSPRRPAGVVLDSVALDGRLGGNRDIDSDSDTGTGSQSGGGLDNARPPQNLAGELQASGSGGPGSSDSSSRHSSGSRRPSEAGSGQRGPSGNRSRGSRGPGTQSEAGSSQSGASEYHSIGSGRQSEAGSRQSSGSNRRSNTSGGPANAANLPPPLLEIPEWLATHPHGPCQDCLPVFRFPPELGELPTCGCICDLARGNNPPGSAGGSSGAGPSRSRASSGRSVRFADNSPAAGENSGQTNVQNNVQNGGQTNGPNNAGNNAKDDDMNLDMNDPVNNLDDSEYGDDPDWEYLRTIGLLGDIKRNIRAKPDRKAAERAERREEDQPAGKAPDYQAGTVPIQTPEEERPSVVDPAAVDPAAVDPAVVEPEVEAPAITAAGGSGGGRCPCCGRGTYGVPPPGGVPQVTFYTCRNMAGQPVNPPAQEPVSLAEGLRNVLASIGLVLPRRGRNADAPAGPAPPAEPAPPATGPAGGVRMEPPPDSEHMPGVASWTAAPRDWFVTLLALLWNFFAVLSLQQWPGMFRAWVMSLLPWLAQMGVYFNRRYVFGQDVVRPALARLPVIHYRSIAMFLLGLWFVTMVIALIEERRIWRAANAQRSAAYYRGSALRTPYPIYPVFEADSGLIQPFFGDMSRRLNRWYFEV